MLKSIKDITKPLKHIRKILKCEIMDDLNQYKNKRTLFTQFTDESINELFLTSFYQFKNLELYVHFHKEKTYAYSIFKNNFAKYFTLYGIKQIQLDKKQLYPFIYQIMYDENPKINLEYINSVIKFLKDNKKYKGKYVVNLLFFKRKDVEFTIKDAKFLLDSKKSLNSLIIYNKSQRQKCTIASLFFNQNSLDFLNMMNFNKHLELNKRNKMFSQYRNFLFGKIDTSDHYKFMLYSSIVLFLLGARNNNDLDIYIDDLAKSNTYNIYSLIKDRLIENKIGDCDVSIKNTEHWPHYWDQWLDEWASLSEAKKFKYIIGKNDYHFYFLGIKIIGVNCDIQRRIARNRPRAIGDLIMLKRKFNMDIRIPRIPKDKTEFKNGKELNSEEIRKLLEDGWSFNRRLNEYSKKVPIVKKRFHDTIQWFIKKNYDEDVSMYYIKQLVK